MRGVVRREDSVWGNMKKEPGSFFTWVVERGFSQDTPEVFFRLDDIETETYRPTELVKCLLHSGRINGSWPMAHGSET